MSRGGAGSTVLVLSGNEAVAELLELLARHFRAGLIVEIPAIYPVPHLGPHAVRIGGGATYLLEAAHELPGVVPAQADEDWSEADTAPGRPRRGRK